MSMNFSYPESVYVMLCYVIHYKYVIESYSILIKILFLNNSNNVKNMNIPVLD